MTQAGPQTHTARRALDIAFAALDQPESSRRAWALAQCAEDCTLAAEVEALLAADQSDEPRLDLSAMNDELIDPRIGTRIGRYRISARIGTGGMGAVYRGEPEEGVAQQAVALKLIKRGMDSEDILRRFMREREILGRLEHPNIARLLDGGLTDDGSPWFALELVQGLPLHRYCDQQQLSLAQRIRLFLQVCEAVEYAHRNLVIHRDLKPGNVLVTPDAQVKLLDFGIARLVGTEQAQATRTRAVVLTPEYSAPEQFERGHITTQTDVYQLGVLLGELLSGQRPARPGASATTQGSERLLSSLSARSSEQDPELLVRAQARAISVRGLVRALRGDLDRIVRKATHAEPERRYASAFALADDLRRYLNGRPVLAMGDSLGYWLGKFVQRNRWGVAGLLTILVSVGVGWISTAREAERLRIALDQSSAMQALLEEVFLGADPWAAKGVDTLASDLLRATEEKLQTQLHLSPALTSTLWFKIGGVHVSLRETEPAVHALQQSIKVANQALVCTGLDCVGVDALALRIQNASARARLAHFVLQETPTDAEAMQQLKAVADELRAYGSNAELDLADTLMMWVHVKVSVGQLDDVKAASEEIVAIKERRMGEQSDEAMQVRAYHASTLRQLGLNAEALRSAELAYQRLQASTGEVAVAVQVYVAQQFGAALTVNKRYAEAERVLSEAIGEVQGEHVAFQTMRRGLLWELIALKTQLGKYADAIDLARQYLATEELAPYERAAGQNKLGVALLGADDAAAALVELEAARATFCDGGQSSPPCLIGQSYVVDALLALRRWRDSEQRLAQLRDPARAQGGRLAIRTLLQETRLRIGLGELDAADLALATAHSVVGESGEEGDRIAATLVAAQLADARRQTAKALGLYRDVLAWHERQGTDESKPARTASDAIQHLERVGL